MRKQSLVIKQSSGIGDAVAVIGSHFTDKT